MKTKKIILTVAIMIVLLLALIPQSVFAARATTPKYLGITALRTNNTPNFGYAIGNPSVPSGAKIWNIVEHTEEGSNTPLKADGSKNIYCIKAGVGFTDLDKSYKYDVYFDDMKTKRTEIKNQNEILASLVDGTAGEENNKVSKYDALLALGNMLYFAEDTDADKIEYLKLAGIDTDHESFLLTTDDILAVQQAVIWYFTNYGEYEGKYDKYEDTNWIQYTTDDITYNSLSDYERTTGEGFKREEQAMKLYKYLIDTAKENASNYSEPTGEVVEEKRAPAELITSKLNYTVSGTDYIVGPIHIDTIEGNTMPYTIDFSVNKDFKFYINGQEAREGTTAKDLVGQDFYISVEDIEDIEVTVDIKYSDNKLVLWASSTNNQEQPVLIPEKHLNSDPKTLRLDAKPFDLALRKYITKINDVEVTNTRVPSIDESTLSSGTTATYKHRKDPVSVETGDIVTYNITIYNEGEKAGRATQIIDQLPTGLQFKRVVSGNFEEVQIDGGPNTNTIYLNRKANNEDNLEAYTQGHLSSETIEIECEVIATPDTANKKVLTNVAWISSAYDAESGTEIYDQVGLDRDSEPATHPDVDKDNMSDYKGNSDNKSVISEDGQGYPDYYYKGEQDDDDFEKLVLEPQTFDLKLIKNITEVNGKAVTERLKSIDVSKLNVSSNPETTATYDMDKTPIAVAKGDIVTYRLRVYNEGTLDGYATEITEDIPEGLEFIWSTKSGADLEADTTLTDDEKEAIAFNQQYLWGNFKYNDSRDRIIEISSDYLSRDNETIAGDGSNLITAFGKNNGTKTANDLSSKEIFVKMKVTSDNVTGITIRNEACISEDSDKDGREIDDRDSDTEVWKKYEDDEDFDNIILKPFDLALRKFIIAVSDDETIESSEYLRSNGKYTRQPDVDTTKLNTVGTDGKLITTATYNHTKEPVELKKGDIVVYMLRVYNEGDIDGYAAEIKDHLPSNLEFVEGAYNDQYGWTISEDGRTATTKYLENEKILAAEDMPNWEAPTVNGNHNYQPYTLSYKEVPIMCRVKDTAKVGEKITNIADITKYLDENKQTVTDRDSQENNVDAVEGNKPEYKDNEKGSYIPGQQDDDDFEKVIVPQFDLALRKQITSIYNSFTKKETKYNDRYAKLDNSKENTIYDYYDVESNIPTVVENDVVTYSIRIYNEGKVDGTATWVTDRLPSGLQFLPDDETNKEYGWKAYKLSNKDAEKAVKIGEKYYEEVSFDSKDVYMYATEYLKDETIKAYTGIGEATYKEVFMTTRVKAKSEVAEGTKYQLRNIAEIGDDNNDDSDSTPGDESEWKDQDDVDIEDLKLVEFDLALRKWVTQAIVIENNGQTVTETGHQPYDDPEQVVKVELHRKKLNQVTVKFRYSIRIINEGDIAGYAKEITDYVPQGLKFVAEDNPGWTDEGNNVISTRLLEGTLLQPGEFADVEVLLTWVNDQDNMGVMVNTAEISEDYNEYGVPDRDSTPDNKKWGEDDIDDAPVMLSISTGKAVTYFTLGFVILVTIAGGVVLIKKYVL